MKDMTFSYLLTQLSDADYKKDTEIVNKINSVGYTVVPYSSYSAYKRGEVIPSFDKARIILNHFNYKISDGDLIKILQYSKLQNKDSIRIDVVKKTIVLNPEEYGVKTKNELNLLLEQQAEKKGCGKSISKYLNLLITEDLSKT